MICNQSEIHGWFDFPGVYDKIAEEISDGMSFAEVGVYLGASLCYLAKNIIKLNKTNIKLYAIDIWKQNHTYNNFMANCIENKVNQIITPIRACSDMAQYNFPANSLFAVMLDGCHKYESVVKDIRNYLPKVTKYLIGHDYQLKTVAKAVKDELNDNVSVIGNTWVYTK